MTDLSDMTSMPAKRMTILSARGVEATSTNSCAVISSVPSQSTGLLHGKLAVKPPEDLPG